MDNYLETDVKINFKKGMTLSEYMNQMKPEDNQATEDQIPENSEDLYQTCLIKQKRSPSTKIIPFNIPQMDEDNYQSSVDFTPQSGDYASQLAQDESKNKTPYFKEKSTKSSDIQITTMYNPKKTQKTDSGIEKQTNKEYRIKHQSNSPFKRDYQFTPTKNNLSKTLYGNTFLSNNLSNMSTASSTLYQNKFGKLNQKSVLQQVQSSLKGTIHSKQSKNQKYFQQKNKRDIDHIIQYENNIKLKYNHKINVLDIRIDGFKDKIYQRKNRIFH